MAILNLEKPVKKLLAEMDAQRLQRDQGSVDNSRTREQGIAPEPLVSDTSLQQQVTKENKRVLREEARIEFGPITRVPSPINIEDIKKQITKSFKFKDKRLKTTKKKMFRRDI